MVKQSGLLHQTEHGKDFNTMNDAAKALGMNPGSIANNLKSNGVCNNGYRFKTTVPNFSQP